MLTVFVRCMAQVMTIVACVGWMAISSALIMINKYLMSTDGFHYPMALSCLGMLFSSVASFLACRVSPLSLAIRSHAQHIVCILALLPERQIRSNIPSFTLSYSQPYTWLCLGMIDTISYGGKL